MRLVAWNCCAGPLERKLAALDSLAADLAVVPECPELPRRAGATWWLGDNPHKGLGVIARGPWRVTAVRTRCRFPRYIQPLRVCGPTTFVLWAVWAMNDGADRYVRAVHRAVDMSARSLRTYPTVMLGDFNSNAIWDHEHPKNQGHTGLVHKLHALGLTSSYHAHHGEAHGAESRPTFFEYRHEHRPYHIDYGFVPLAWAGRIRTVTLGGHSTWAGLSDHMPLVIDLDLPPD